MTAAILAAALRLVAPMCPADTTPPAVVVERITACAGRVSVHGEMVAKGCFYEDRPDLIVIDPRAPRWQAGPHHRRPRADPPRPVPVRRPLRRRASRGPPHPRGAGLMARSASITVHAAGIPEVARALVAAQNEITRLAALLAVAEAVCEAVNEHGDDLGDVGAAMDNWRKVRDR